MFPPISSIGSFYLNSNPILASTQFCLHPRRIYLNPYLDSTLIVDNSTPIVFLPPYSPSYPSLYIIPYLPPYPPPYPISRLSN